MQEDVELTLSPYGGCGQPLIGPIIYRSTGVLGFFRSEQVTASAGPGEYLHLFWEGAYWVMCEGPRDYVRQAVYRTKQQDIFRETVQWDLNRLAHRVNRDFSTQCWTSGMETKCSIRRIPDGKGGDALEADLQSQP